MSFNEQVVKHRVYNLFLLQNNYTQYTYKDQGGGGGLGKLYGQFKLEFNHSNGTYLEQHLQITFDELLSF